MVDETNANLERSDKPLLASFLFAAPPAGKYLSQFIDSYISCVNQIPIELLGKTTVALFLFRILDLISKCCPF